MDTTARRTPKIRLAILTSGRLPVPATKGGAVETKLDYILDYNARHHVMDITVYSIKPDKDIDKSTPENHYVFFRIDTLWDRLMRKILSWTGTFKYYDSHIEYFLSKCIHHVKGQRYDAILLANRPGYALRLAHQVKSPLIIQIDNDYLNPDIYRVKEMMEASSLVIACSDYLRRRALEVKCDREVSIVTVHNGIDIKRFIEAVPLDRARLGLTNDDFVVIFSGRLTKEKGIVELINAVKLLQHIPELKLIILGASFYGKDTQTSPFLLKLQQEAEPIKERVVFTGFIDYAQMPSYLKMADLAVVPSVWEEPFGLTVVEAMAAGVPLITTRCGGIPEICEGVAEMVERENIVEHLANAIADLYQNPAKRERMAKVAQERSRLFDKDTFARNFLTSIIEPSLQSI